jgi:hypothetical protein
MENGHLRPHPTEVANRRNISKKFEMKERTDDYLFVFNPGDYVDIIINNITGTPTQTYVGLKYALKFSQKPFVFFTCYDVGPNEILKVFVQHVVCTLAIREGDGLNLYFFDMRSLRDISPDMKTHMEKEFSKIANVPVHIINTACVDRSKCVYLQRFKGDNEMGWCIAWAMLFLDYLTDNTDILHLSPEGRKRRFAKLYTELDKHLAGPRTNHFIEVYYRRIMGL